MSAPDQQYTPQAAIDAANAAFGKQTDNRALHAKGLVCAGTFTATPAAKELSSAAHLQGEEIEVVARFSNGGGAPRRADFKPDPRGLAVKFRLPDGSRTDIVAVNAPVFIAATPDAFIDLLRAQASGPSAMLTLLRKYPGMVPALIKGIPGTLPPAGLETINYHALHAFGLTNAAGERHWVRYHLSTTEPARFLTLSTARRRGPDYLFDGLRARLATGPIRYTLEAEVAEPGDQTADPSKAWPKSRPRVTLGTITIDRLDPSPEEDGNILVFDPTRVIPGVELSDDPVLRFRSAAYSESVERRTGVARED